MDYLPIYVMIALMVVVTALGLTYAWWRARATSRPRAAQRDERVRRIGTGPVRPALLLAAIAAAEDGQPFDRAAYRRFAAPELTDLDREGYLGELNASLGVSADTVGPHLRLAQEVLAQRSLAGPALWRHQLEDRFTAWSLPLAERQEGMQYADLIEQCEQVYRGTGLLGADERIDTVAPVHWAHAVRLAREGHAGGALTDADLEAWLARADALVTTRFGTRYGAALAAVLLPTALSGRDLEWRRRIGLAQHVLALAQPAMPQPTMPPPAGPEPSVPDQAGAPPGPAAPEPRSRQPAADPEAPEASPEP